MAAFADNPSTFQRRDYALLQNSPIAMYYRRAVLEEDVAWLSAQGYLIDRLDGSAWSSKDHVLSDIARTLQFPDCFGKNLDALNDCLRDVAVPDAGGRVVVFVGYDRVATLLPEFAWQVLDVFACQSRAHLLFGRHLLVLIQSADPRISFKQVGACPAMWNPREWLNKVRGV